MRQDIEELIRENNGQDIEIEFYFGDQKLDLNTSIYEMTQNKTQKPKNKDLSSNPLSSFMATLAGENSEF